jgi:hypothetical protein
MKKLILSLCLLAGTISSSRAQFFETVDYIGALDKNESNDWTKSWTNWNPKQTPYGKVSDSTTLFSSTGQVNITSTLTLDPSKVYLLKSLVVVRSGGRLNIPAGTVIRGSADATATPKQYATLVVERGGYISIEGNKSNPVVFTSNKPEGSRDRGDWGGIVICGKAINNQGNDIQVEGFNNISFDNTIAKFGGIIDDDNSGKISYLRVEFAGTAFEPNKEINGITFASVGSGTSADFIQVSYSGDDSYEWFGGSINLKHIIAFKGTDDDFDTDFGYRGGVQFGIAYKDSSYFDLSWNSPSGSSTSECFESDNDASGSGRLPLTSAVFSNMTCVGPVPAGMTWSELTTTQKGAFRRGVRIRRNSRLSIVNSIFMGYRNFIMFDGDSTQWASGVKNNTISDKNNLFRNNYIYSYKSAAPAGSTNTGLVEVNGTLKPSTLDSWIRKTENFNLVDTNLTAPKTLLFNTNEKLGDLDFRPINSNTPNYTFNLLKSYGTWSKVYEIKREKFVLYPNPSDEGFFFNNRPVNYKLINSNGETVKEGHGNRVETRDISEGNYYLLSEVGASKVIIKH